jgi:uncharacterized protein DUF2680
MFTRARIAAGSAAAGALLLGAAAIAGLGWLPAAAEAAQSDSTGQQVRQVQPQPSPSPSPAVPHGPRGGRHRDPQQAQQMREQFLNRLAGNLGISRDQLVEGFRKTRVDMVNQAVTEGRLTREQADQIIQRIDSGRRPGGGPRPSAGLGRSS